MVKRRPAIIISKPIPGRSLLCSIVPLSTTPPNPVLPHHMKITFSPPLPAPYDNPMAWVKGRYGQMIANYHGVSQESPVFTRGFLFYLPFKLIEPKLDLYRAFGHNARHHGPARLARFTYYRIE
jgi:hypothetical protein